MAETGRNPEPQVGDVWEFEGQHRYRIDFISPRAEVRLKSISASEDRLMRMWMSIVLFRDTKYWRRVSTAPTQQPGEGAVDG